MGPSACPDGLPVADISDAAFDRTDRHGDLGRNAGYRKRFARHEGNEQSSQRSDHRCIPEAGRTGVRSFSGMP